MSQIVSKPRVSLQFDPGRGRRDGDTSHLRGAIRDIRAELCASTLLYCRGEQEQHRPTSTLYGHTHPRIDSLEDSWRARGKVSIGELSLLDTVISLANHPHIR
jgi:hypothetical protein